MENIYILAALGGPILAIVIVIALIVELKYKNYVSSSKQTTQQSRVH
jgi:Tfp pilus assembly protein PilE